MALQHRTYAEISGSSAVPVGQGVRDCDLVYSGAVWGMDMATGVVPDRVDEEMALAFANLQAALERAGAGQENVGHVTILLRDLADTSAINPPWVELFPDPESRPPYIFLETSLPAGLRVQLQSVAVAGQVRTAIEIPGLSHGNPIPMGARVGSLVFSSRILSRDPDSGAQGETADEQAAITLGNMKRLLELAGGTLDDAAQVTVFLSDFAHRPAADAAWRQTFPAGSGPDRHDIVTKLPGRNMVMVKVIADLRA